jgi:site-specific recombinase XerD
MAKNSRITLRYPQYQSILDKYLELAEIKILVPSSIRRKESTITSLCNYLGDIGIFSFRSCQHQDIVNYLRHISDLAKSTISGISFIIRHFFNFLYCQKITLYSGNELFPVIVTNKRDRILSFYSEDEVKKLISSVKHTNSKGKTDLAVVLLAAELGIRSGDISRLHLSDLHWERNTIEFVQSKTGIFNQLPLLDNLKYALIDYLSSARPACNSDLLFVGIKNNFGMISNSQIHGMVSKYFTIAGLDITKRKHGPHALRHSLASKLLKNDTPMYVIKDILGHTNLNTTKIYLNIDLETLSHFALEVPDAIY